LLKKHSGIPAKYLSSVTAVGHGVRYHPNLSALPLAVSDRALERATQGDTLRNDSM